MNEDVSHKETVCSVHCFMEWNYKPDFNSTYGPYWENPNNPWRGKNPKPNSKVLLGLSPDDRLCQKMENLNLQICQGHPSMSQKAGCLKTDQFISWPKTHSVSDDNKAC